MGQRLSPPSASLGACIIAVSFFQWVSVYCILVILKKYQQDEGTIPNSAHKVPRDFEKVETSPDKNRI